MSNSEIPKTGDITNKSILIDTSDVVREHQSANQQKFQLIDQAEQRGDISGALAALLRRINTATTLPGESNLNKVKAVMEMRERLKKEMDQQGRMVYIGSGVDWEFPVALGARKIEMLDISLAEESIMAKLKDSVSAVDENLVTDPDGSIHFKIDVGDGSEIVLLKPIIADIETYTPTTNINAVLEFAGPTKIFYPTKMVTPKIGKQLATGSVVINLDFVHNPEAVIPEGVDKVSFPSGNILIIADEKRFKNSLTKSDQARRIKHPSLASLRNLIRRRKV